MPNEAESADTHKRLIDVCQELNTLLAVNKLKDKENSTFKANVTTKLDEVLGKINEIALLEARCTTLEGDVVDLRKDIDVILSDEKDKVKVWKRNTFAFGLLILSAVISILFKGAPK